MSVRDVEARRAYMREWNKKNRDKKRMYQERYWAKKAAAMELAQSQSRHSAGLAMRTSSK